MRKLSLVVLALACSSVFAQPRPALVQDRDQPARQPWMQLIQVAQDVANCGASLNACQADFDVVPAGKRLVVTHASVHLTVANAEGLMAFTGPNFATPPFAHFLPMTPQFQQHFAGGGPVLYYVEAGLRPYFLAVSPLIGGTGVASFALSGYFINLP